MSSVDHPQYYGGNDNVYEAIKIIEHFNLDFHLGNALKYLIRSGKKNKNKEIEDLEKSIWYITRKIENLRRAKTPEN